MKILKPLSLLSVIIVLILITLSMLELNTKSEVNNSGIRMSDTIVGPEIINGSKETLQNNKENNIEKFDKNNFSEEVSNEVNKFLVKVAFSAIFLLSALYVILSKKYDDETKKWAFNILTLIAGVWIGSFTK